MLAAMAAREIGRPVKIELTRRQMFGPVGGRPRTVQHITLGAKKDGTLTAIRHVSTSATSELEEWMEPSAVATRMLYASPNAETDHKLVRINIGTPTFMRAPGEATGTFAIESAMDELAYALQHGSDRVPAEELRREGSAERQAVVEQVAARVLRAGAEKFGWSQRTPEPRSMRDGDALIGYGMATATYPTRRSPASAIARILPDGRAWVRAGSQDLGTGTYTVMTQVAADALGIPPERVRFELGDTEMPETPVSGGSQTAASVGSAVNAAALAARSKVVQLAIGDCAVAAARRAARTMCASTTARCRSRRIRRRRNRTARSSRAMAASRSRPRRARSQVRRPRSFRCTRSARCSPRCAWTASSAQIRVPRVVGAYGVGKVLNAKTARSQLIGGIVYGIGMALMEETLHRSAISAAT